MSQEERVRARRDTIGDAIRRSARRYPQKDAIIFSDRRWTYSQLDEAVNRVANALISKGLTKGDRVAAYAMNSDAYMLLWLGCTRAGLIHVPINFALKNDELLYILEQSGSRAVFSDSFLSEDVERVLDRAGNVRLHGTMYDGSEDFDADFDVVEFALDEAGDASEPDVEISEDDIAQILYTSGTTAAPKGAALSHRALMAEYISCIVELGFRYDERVLHSLPLYHSAQMHVFLMPDLLVGATNFVLQKPDPEAFGRIIEEEKIDSLFLPPTVWISFLRHPAFEAHDLTSLRKVQYGSSIMPVPVLRELREKLPNPQFFNCYGQSEISPLATVLRPEEHEEDRLASAGRPALLVETRVVDPEMNDCAPGEAGEIVHRSPHLMRDYWEKPDETAEAFEGGWFHSGDLGYMDEEGYLYVVDRIKDVINTGGEVVSGRDVEDVIYTHDSVKEVAVIGLPDEKWIEAVTAVVVKREDADESDLEAEIIRHAKEKLARYKVPKRVYFVDDLPRNASGKILKRELREEYSSSG